MGFARRLSTRAAGLNCSGASNFQLVGVSEDVTGSRTKDRTRDATRNGAGCRNKDEFSIVESLAYFFDRRSNQANIE
jgi:hypothetical protein